MRRMPLPVTWSVAAVAGEVFLGDEAFDDGGAGGGGAEAALGHGLARGLRRR